MTQVDSPPPASAPPTSAVAASVSPENARPLSFSEHEDIVQKHVKKSIPYGRHTLTIETGEVARQAGGAVMVSLDDSVVLVTAVAAKQAKPGQDFFPLTVDYQE